MKSLPLATTLGLTVALLFLPAPRAGAVPLTLAEAIAEAQRNNPDAALARQRIAQAAAGVGQADARLWPRLSLVGGYTRTDNPIGVFGAALNQRTFSPALNFNDVPDADNLNVGGRVTVPLFTSGQIPAERAAARASQAASAQAHEAVQNRLAFEVARLFFTLQKARAVIAAATATVAGFEQGLDIARKRFETGKALRVDVLDLEVRLAEAREQLVQARNARELARRALGNVLGRETDPPEVAEHAPLAAAPAGETAPSRPELLALRREQAAAEAAVRSARSGHGPKVSAFAAAEHNHGWRFNGSGENYTAGLLVNWNLWDGFLTRGRVNAARAEVDMAAERLRQMRLAVDFEVQQARLNLESAIQRVGVSGKAVELAAESLQLTRVRFEQGLALATQLIDAETALTNARVRRAQAEADRHIAVAALRAALGLPQLDAAPNP